MSRKKLAVGKTRVSHDKRYSRFPCKLSVMSRKKLAVGKTRVSHDKRYSPVNKVIIMNKKEVYYMG